MTQARTARRENMAMGSNGHGSLKVSGVSIWDVDGRTEQANGARFARRFGSDVRYVATWDKWIVWDETRWKLDLGEQVAAMAKEITKGLFTDVARQGEFKDSKEVTTALQFAKATGSKNGQRNLVTLAQSEPGIAIDNALLDVQPWRLNVLNGTIDLRSGRLMDHDRGDYFTTVAPVEFDAAAACPRWLAFLERIFNGDGELIAFIRRAVGSCLTGVVLDHVLFLCYGCGANGKSVFLNVLQALLGSDLAMTAPLDLLMVKPGDTHPTERADLCGKRLVSCIESGDGRRLNENLVKTLTGGDRIRARRMREDFWEFAATFKLWMATNHKPTIRGTDNGIWRRMRLIPFAVTIPTEEQDPMLAAKLRAELPGILNWAIGGCLDWQRDGLGEAEAVSAATSAYRDEQDVVGEFLAECTTEAPSARATAGDLYRAYTTWSDASGYRAVSQRTFGEALAERFERKRSGGKHYWQGIGLLASASEERNGHVQAKAF